MKDCGLSPTVSGCQYSEGLVSSSPLCLLQHLLLLVLEEANLEIFFSYCGHYSLRKMHGRTFYDVF